MFVFNIFFVVLAFSHKDEHDHSDDYDEDTNRCCRARWQIRTLAWLNGNMMMNMMIVMMTEIETEKQTQRNKTRGLPY